MNAHVMPYTCGIQIVTFQKQYNDVIVISAEGY